MSAHAEFRLACEVAFDDPVDGLGERRVQQLVAAALNEAGVAEGDDVEASVTFCDEQRIAQANVDHREVDGPTDVLAFPIDGLDTMLGPGEPRVLGDLLVCPSYVARQIAEGLTMQGEVELVAALERCVVHGTLHLAGFDHERSEADAEHMLDLEQLVLDRVRGVHVDLGARSDLGDDRDPGA